MRSLFLCSPVALLASAMLAAPVPPPRPAPRPWHFGWGKPEDPVGGCRFDRDGGRLTVTVPGEGRDVDIYEGDYNGPRLMRDIEGDFRIQVRVRGNFLAAGPARAAGILLRCGDNAAVVQLGNVLKAGASNPGAGRTTSLTDWRDAAGRAAHLRLERKGQKLVMQASLDGQEWDFHFDRACLFSLPRKVQVGVFASSVVKGRFTATFDRLSFTRPKPAKKAR